jgi:uncharacterized phage-associated protein
MPTSIRFKFNALKTVQVAAMFLDMHGGTMKYLGLLKLLYLADRAALTKLDYPLSGDKYYSMEFGPVMSNTYDLIKNRQIPGAIEIWKEYISTRDESSGYVVELLNPPGDDELSEEEVEIIREIYKKHGGQDRFDLVELTHQLPEWQNPGKTSILIDVEKLLIHLGKTEEKIKSISDVVAREAYLDEILNG